MDKDYLTEMAKAIEAKLPDNHGFILMAFPFSDEEGRLIYTASCAREDAIKVVKSWLYHQGEKENWMEHIK